MKYKQYKQNSGFTLIEILVAITLMGILGLILTNILSQVLRGQNKINVVSQVKQNGQMVLDKLSTEIRSAEGVICRGKNADNRVGSAELYDTIVIYKGGNYTRFRFIPPSPSPNATINGHFTREDFTKDVFPDSVTDENMCSQANNFIAPIDITDKGAVGGISINYDSNKPIFEKEVPVPGSPELVLIRFRASQGVSTGQTAESTVAEGGVLFTTAAAVRGGK